MSNLNKKNKSQFRAFQGTIPTNVSQHNQSCSIDVSIRQPVGGLINVYETEPDWGKGVWVRHYTGVRIGELILQSEKFIPFCLNEYSWCNLDESTKEGLRRLMGL